MIKNENEINHLNHEDKRTLITHAKHLKENHLQTHHTLRLWLKKPIHCHTVTARFCDKTQVRKKNTQIRLC